VVNVSETEDYCCAVVVNCCCYILVAAAREQLRNLEEEECPPLEAVTRGLIKTQKSEKILTVCSGEL
jgi:hypothetical protein